MMYIYAADHLEEIEGVANNGKTVETKWTVLFTIINRFDTSTFRTAGSILFDIF